MINWTGYLQSLCGDDKYVHWQQHYTVTDVVGRQLVDQKAPPWLFDLMVQTVQLEKEEPREGREKTERLGVLDGLRKYAPEHVLLVGRPGSGKSTALIRLLLEEAQTRLEINFHANSKTRLKTTEYPVSSSLKRTSALSQGINSLADLRIPVLVELRYYQTSVVDLIRSFLKQHGLLLDTAEIEKLLFEQQLLLLFDGVNELPSEVARRDLLAFRQENIATPMIFTTRDLGVGGDLNITKKLEMQPLTEPQMQQFVKKYLPAQGEQMLQELGDRLREFGETPLLLMMLCSLFQQTHKNIPPNLGMVFRQFTQFCENQRLEGVLVTDNSRRWWRLMLQHLALRMTQGTEKTELQVAISREEAEEILTAFLQQEQFDQPRDRAISWLNELLKYHLIQLGAGDKIEFRHQLIQEYYTAESLLKQLPNLLNNEDRFKREYLNYLKWTEPLVLMLELVEDEKQVLRIVELALEVDLRLGARLAGAVKLEFQVQTVGFVAKLEIPQLVKIQLLAVTRSKQAISHIQPALNDEDSDVRWRAAEALGKIGSSEAVEVWKLALNNKYSNVRIRAAEALVKIGSSEVVEVLKKALNDEDFRVRSRAANALGKIAAPQLMPELNDILRTNTELDLLDTIAAIQERCKFYNYTLTQLPLSPATPNPICMATYNILHLSDLHFGSSENADNWYNQLAEDLYQELKCLPLDVLILSGDIANKSTPEEYNAAKQFINKISEEFHLQPEQIVIVPGNHDLNWGLAKKAYKLIDIEDLQGTLTEGFYIKESESVIRVRDEEKYQQRFTHFSQFYQAIKNKPYPLEYEQQAILHHFPAQNLLILGLNSAWQLDHHYKSRASIRPEAINKAITDIRKNPEYQNCLKIAVWHHPLTSAFEDRITDHGFMEQLAKAGFRFALHGHIHKADTSLYKYDLSADGRKLDIICAGTFGAPIREWVPGYPLQYNLLKFADNQLTVHTRRREELNGAWKPDARWLMGAGQNPLPYYEIAF
jgi:3',5'-cyclic AMP phosphodiesterase CpdA/DNA polymerase III delta prime subunit